jgi:hypothetical protein
MFAFYQIRIENQYENALNSNYFGAKLLPQVAYLRAGR